MGSKPKSYNTFAVVLRRANGRDTDRIVTLLSQDKGKIVVVAKGARKMSSSKRAMLEPGMVIRCQLIETRGLPILTQAQMIEEFSGCRTDLEKIRQLSQILEIVNALFVEEDPGEDLYQSVISMVRMVDSGRTGFIRQSLSDLISQLGFQDFADTTHESIAEYVSELTGKPLNSWVFLRVKS